MENVNKQLLDALVGYDNIVRIVLNGLRRDYEERGLMIRKEFHDELSAAHAKACEAVFDAKEEMKAIAAAEHAQLAEPVAWKPGKRPPSVFKTSEAGRQYVADFFANAMRRHDFSSYIKGHLAADFACALADGLHAMQKAQQSHNGELAACDVLNNDLPDAVIEATAEAIGEAYDCVRVWEAWSVGTMGPDDFRQVADDSDRVAEIARAAIIAWHGGTAHPPAVADRDAIRCVFMAHGFTIKDGQTDLKPYVYEAAEALLRELSPAMAVPDEVAKDAARYRWLRQDESEFSSMAPAELDAAIDKAIAAAQKGSQ